MQKRQYGLFTSIAMIIGVVIGSGIFFKSDNILVFTGGNVWLGVLVFVLAAIAIIFGGLTISELASRTDEPGGVVAYAREFCSGRIACAMGWFQCFLYYPTLVAVVAWVASIYTDLLFGWGLTFEMQIGVTVGYIILFYLLSILSSRMAGLFQNASTLIKLLPLALFAIAGFLFGNPTQAMPTAAAAFGSVGWIAAVGPIAFSFDGWIVTTSIAHEVKDAKKNLPIALVSAPLFVLFAYVLYFVGITRLVDPQQIMAMGDSHVDYAANLLLGPLGARIVLVFVIISVLGTVNGLVMGFTRMPQSLVGMGYLPQSCAGNKEGTGVDTRSALISMALSLFWLGAHYFTTQYGLLPNSDISEIAIVASYGTYLVLYGKVLQMGMEGKITGVFKGKVFPIMAMVGVAIVFWGGLQNPLFPLYLGICIAVMGLSQLYYGKKPA